MITPKTCCAAIRHKWLFAVVFCAGFFNHTLADDIEVYGSNYGVTNKPNVLFIIDSSDSMEYDTNGESASGDDRKVAILRRVFADVLSQSLGKINVGVTFFNSRTSGIKWPVSDITLEANAIDPDIPAGVKVEDVLVSLVNHYGTWDATNPLGGLSEAMRYFRGEPVWYNNWTWPSSAEPQRWSADYDRYTGGAGMSPSRYSYAPLDAFVPGGDGPDPKTNTCDDYSPFDASGPNYCEGRTLVSDNPSTACTFIAGRTYTYTYCPGGYSCVEPLGQGECGRWDCPGGVQEATATSSDRLQCDYYVGSWVVPDYVSPISAPCQGNFIILLSDGMPSVNDTPWAALDTLGLSNVSACEDISGSVFGDVSKTAGNCSGEVVRMLYETDQIPGMRPSNVVTYTVGFGLVGADAVQGRAFLQYLADQGGGEFFQADDYATLSESLQSIISAITGEADEFTGLGIDVRRTSFSSDNRAFVNLFTPSEKQVWDGNLKGYFIEESGLKDVDGRPVLDSDGKFKPDARSFWSSEADGGLVARGGFSEGLEAGGRTLYTYTGTDEPDDVALAVASGEHRLSADNSALTRELMSVPDDAMRNDILTWVQTAPMSDPLHTKPLVAHYPGGDVIFTMSNQGFLHAVNASTPTRQGNYGGGDEIFAFMPQELLPNLYAIQRNLTTGGHIYGLDGALTLRHDDEDSDGEIDASETAILYFGMRRGGQHYYALDVSDTANPRLLWKISGGSGDFLNLAQTWSRMTLTTVRHGGSAKKVLIFGGGYDVANDHATAREPAAGSQLYIVDADNGRLLWSVGHAGASVTASDMRYSIASDITTIDLNANGYADRLYFGDMGGQLWRVTFNEAASGSEAPTVDFTRSPSVERIGDFGGDQNRRFYYPPAVAMIADQGDRYLAVTIGSGNRAHPLDTSVDDWIFMLRDPVEAPLAHTVKMSDLYDATDNQVAEGSDTASEREALATADGWKMRLNSGEKSLSTLVVFDGKLRFTTYEPTSVDDAVCGSSATARGRYYVMNLVDATPTSDDSSEDDALLTKDDRWSDIDGLGIPGSPMLAFLPDSDGVDVYVGKENVGRISSDIRRIYWQQTH